LEQVSFVDALGVRQIKLTIMVQAFQARHSSSVYRPLLMLLSAWTRSSILQELRVIVRPLP
jgi:hypothetical protein